MSERQSVGPHVVRVHIQACVPKDWANEQIEDFADAECPCFTLNVMDDCEEFPRTKCAEDEDFVHVWMYATTSGPKEEKNG